MQPFRTILFAADFSENSKEAFRAACSLAVEDKTRLMIVHVVEPDRVLREPINAGRPTTTPLLGKKDEGPHEALRQKMCEVYTPNHPIDVACHAREGDIPAEILRMADQVGADLIVMGTHGRTGLRRLLAGSIATAVLRGAHCPVLALRSRAGTHKAEDIRVILHPTDFSQASEAALGVARSLARDLGTRLLILHVFPLNIYLEGRMAAELDPRDYQHSLDMIRERLEGPDLKYPVETRLSRGFEAEEILRVAEDVGCDLIVMGTHGRTGLGRLLMGSTAESVLPKAACPVMVVKAPQHVPAATSNQPADKMVTVF